MSGTGSPGVLPLKPFQDRSTAAIAKVVQDTARLIALDPSRRREIALATGVTLLRAPTGSGKTLMLGRALEGLVGKVPGKVVWLWFTPFSGLVAQTRDALAAQCPALRLRDPATDRRVEGTRDGDVFVLTWQSVAAANGDARRARQDGESLPGLDTMLAALRADGIHVGAIIDEAHLNFGTGAPQAARFYLDTVRPDFTVLATATPRDAELDRFAHATGMGEPNRVEASREEVVRACLNKVGVKAVHFRPDERDEAVLDMDEVAIWAGVQRHRRLKEELAAAGVALTPLLLVQVENAAGGGEDPVKRVQAVLKELGYASDRLGDPVAIHTSGQPDPWFHTLAYDETKEILVFKMAAATGFDAPRAWTLVSLRRSVGSEFGLQVLGRIMRVHPRVQRLHPYASNPPRQALGPLDFGYVFLSNPAQQFGIVDAARELRAVRDSISTVTDDVVVFHVGGGANALLLNPATGFAELLDPPPLPPLAEQETPADQAPAAAGEPVDAPVEEPVRAVAFKVQGWLDQLWGGTSPGADEASREATPDDADAGAGGSNALRRRFPYRLRTDIAFPRSLAREVMPKTMDGLVQCIAGRFNLDDAALTLVQRTLGKVHVTEEDVFGGERDRRTESVPISAARIAQGAQAAFKFNDSIDERDLKPALLARLRHELDQRGIAVGDERQLRRGVDLIALARPHLLTDACRTCLAQVVEVRQDEPIPEFIGSDEELEPAKKSLYGVFPPMNLPETAFARMLDDDTTGTVIWWLRNVSMARWAVSIVLPNGERHFPDFVIGVDARRRSEDQIALAEIKDDGRTGRLYADVNAEKVRTEHSRYRSCLMVTQTRQGEWFNVAFRADLQRQAIAARFSIEELVRVA